MLISRNALLPQAQKRAYVCLDCQRRIRKQFRHTTSTDSSPLAETGTYRASLFAKPQNAVSTANDNDTMRYPRSDASQYSSSHFATLRPMKPQHWQRPRIRFGSETRRERSLTDAPERYISFEGDGQFQAALQKLSEPMVQVGKGIERALGTRRTTTASASTTVAKRGSEESSQYKRTTKDLSKYASTEVSMHNMINAGHVRVRRYHSTPDVVRRCIYRRSVLSRLEKRHVGERRLSLAGIQVSSVQVASQQAQSGNTHNLGDSEPSMGRASDNTSERSHPPSIPKHLKRGMTSALRPISDQRLGLNVRRYHVSSAALQQTMAAVATDTEAPSLPPQDASFQLPSSALGIRDQLRKWQELHGHEDRAPELPLNDDVLSPDQPVNSFTQLPDPNDMTRAFAQNAEEDVTLSHFVDTSKDDAEGVLDANVTYLKPGDLVEIEFPATERESLIAVVVRPLNATSTQLFTIKGRWINHLHKMLPYSIPNWIDPKQLEPLLEYIPTLEQMGDFESFMAKAYVEDLSVPRDVAAPIVEKMRQFHSESQEIYRKHARALDNAHNILSHPDDLRYGSLTSVATTLLNIPSERLPIAALFTVRKALFSGGFAFNVDLRSHRLTGYVQIRSKKQVKMVENVRDWLRQWQDVLATRVAMSEEQITKKKVSAGAAHVFSFITKVKQIILESRENRSPTSSGNIGPSKVFIPLTEGNDCVSVTKHPLFSPEEQDILRFMEVWASSHMFYSAPRIESLPPLVLQATGLYDDMNLDNATGYVFLQELGTVMPYDNRVRYDQHLLLPSSQHSKPLQNLMTAILAMEDDHDLKDSMADLRHDWGNLPVYCIDDAGAHEIDDGLSVETAGTGPDGREQHWVHIHIANPTAFFSREHGLAKMARHMGETIYMPERVYAMLPRWATQRHFSLGRFRPCLTISARLDQDGNTLEHKIQNGFIRNVKRITPDEVGTVLGSGQEQQLERVFIVGGDPPPPLPRRSGISQLKPAHINDLKTLRKLASGRLDIRQRAGGVLFNSYRPNVDVWQSTGNHGLQWDNPFRKGARITTGDPIIRYRTRELTNWFASRSLVDPLVPEMMLLACEVSAKWCAERQIPNICRGTQELPYCRNSEVFLRDVMLPAAAKTGEYPLHLGIQYVETFGTTSLRTSPFKHKLLGMTHYSKVTSPLRRYGDMVLHWQIEAALRHEAETGRSLITDDGNAPRPFLPFSAPVLQGIMQGLQPRERLITRTKDYAWMHWAVMLVWRKFCFPDAPTSFAPADSAPLPDVVRAFVPGRDDRTASSRAIRVNIVELNISGLMRDPAKNGLEQPLAGDVWECRIENISVYKRAIELTPLRLVERVS